MEAGGNAHPNPDGHILSAVVEEVSYPNGGDYIGSTSKLDSHVNSKSEPEDLEFTSLLCPSPRVRSPVKITTAGPNSPAKEAI